MPLSTNVTPSDIATALGRPHPGAGSTTEAQWGMWISDALMLIQVRYDGIGDETLTVDQGRLDYVIREAVAAHARRPDDATQVSVSSDDTSVQKTYRYSRGRVEILDEWWTLLGLTTSSGSAAFSIRPYGSGLGTSAHQPWCNLAFGALYCSCGADLAGFPLWEY